MRGRSLHQRRDIVAASEKTERRVGCKLGRALINTGLLRSQCPRCSQEPTKEVSAIKVGGVPGRDIRIRDSSN